MSPARRTYTIVKRAGDEQHPPHMLARPLARTVSVDHKVSPHPLQHPSPSFGPC
jgi:hypothetical protein